MSAVGRPNNGTAPPLEYRRYISAFEGRVETASPRLNYVNRDREISSIRGGAVRPRSKEISMQTRFFSYLLNTLGSRRL